MSFSQTLQGCCTLANKDLPFLSRSCPSSISSSSKGRLPKSVFVTHLLDDAFRAPQQVIKYLREALHNAGTNETVQHGACLGLGLAAMATGGALYEDLNRTLYTDSANAGEAAAYAIGLIMLGKGGSTLESRNALEGMIAYAHDTAHEKIIRGLAMGIALILYR